MSTARLPNELWVIIQPLLPPEPPKPKGGRPRVPDRPALTDILYVLRTGCLWQSLPKELGCGSGSTCWRRLRDWQRAGVWDRLHRLLLDRNGIPLAALISPANWHNSRMLEPLLDAVRPVKGLWGRPRRRP